MASHTQLTQILQSLRMLARVIVTMVHGTGTATALYLLTRRGIVGLGLINSPRLQCSQWSRVLTQIIGFWIKDGKSGEAEHGRKILPAPRS